MENSVTTQSNQFELPPPNYLIQSIIVTVLCCMPFGIVALLSANKVETLWALGDKAGAIKASKDAKKWCIIGASVGGIFVFLYIIIMIAGVAVGALQGA